MSEIKYATVESEYLTRGTDSCGYFNVQWALFGRGNQANYITNGYKIEFCSTSYYSRDVSAGPIFPVIPLFTSENEAYRNKKWIRVKNESTEGTIYLLGAYNTIGTQLDAVVSFARYPTDRDKSQKMSSQEISLSIQNGKYLWLTIPTGCDFIKLKAGNKYIDLNIVESTGYSWWMVTV